MLCKNCGKELPIAGKFCPFCGAVIEQEGVNDETAVFTSLPDELNGPIDLSAFDAAMKEGHPAAGGAQDGVTSGDPLAATMNCRRSTSPPSSGRQALHRPPAPRISVRPTRMTALTAGLPRGKKQLSSLLLCS